MKLKDEYRIRDYMREFNLGQLLVDFFNSVEKHVGKEIAEGEVLTNVVFVFCEECGQQSFVLTLKQFNGKVDLKVPTICPCCGKKQ